MTLLVATILLWYCSIPTSLAFWNHKHSVIPPLFSNSRNLISVEECLALYHSSAHQSTSNLVFVDGSWYHKGHTLHQGRRSFEAGPRLPQARHVDLDDVCCHADLFPHLNPKGLPHMLPPPNLFEQVMDAMDITNQHLIVIYGCQGVVFTPRTWFLFRSMGHEQVRLMQGSLEDWIQLGGPVDTEPTKVPFARDIWHCKKTPSLYQSTQTNTTTTTATTTAVVNMEHVLKSLETNDSIIIDPRGSSFQSMGHVPGAIHMPYNDFVEPENWLKLKSKDQLLHLFDQAGVDVNTDKSIIATCGSGVSACHVALALEECGRDFTKTKIYDGSWAEWGADPNTPKVLPTNTI